MDGLLPVILRHYPGGVVEEIRPLGEDAGARGDGATRKALGYGIPQRVRVRDAAGTTHELVFHTVRSDDQGHDRRADRIAEVALAYEDFGKLPRHVLALDAGLIGRDGTLHSFSDTAEPYLLTPWAPGEVYATDLRRIVDRGVTAADLQRVDLLASYLAALHRRRVERPATYTRAVRDLLGSGEGIFGIIDGYPPDVPGASAARLYALEQRCLAWRWRLRGREDRRRRIHGDFHPFNIVFDGDALHLLDASRGCVGDPADDVTALAVNYVFFAIDTPGAWRGGLGALWHRLWSRYLAESDDDALLEVAAPWLAWRALVLASPRWYPGLSARGRDALLGWVERALDAPRFEVASADELAP